MISDEKRMLESDERSKTHQKVPNGMLQLRKQMLNQEYQQLEGQRKELQLNFTPEKNEYKGNFQKEYNEYEEQYEFDQYENYASP
mmetsp:Transcript_20167/g.17869  ORF Transcript_20167/g.17869 Transcript_20167/m.17869 type:complete len:85 (-) Transcript_20167:98-352(-)